MKKKKKNKFYGISLVILSLLNLCSTADFAIVSLSTECIRHKSFWFWNGGIFEKKIFQSIAELLQNAKANGEKKGSDDIESGVSFNNLSLVRQIFGKRIEEIEFVIFEWFLKIGKKKKIEFNSTKPSDLSVCNPNSVFIFNYYIVPFSYEIQQLLLSLYLRNCRAWPKKNHQIQKSQCYDRMWEEKA